MRRPLAAALAVLALAACATAPRPPPAPPPPAFAAPTAERIARLDPFDRAAVQVDGELVRLAVVPQGAFAAPAGRGRGGGPAPGPAIVVLREEGAAFVYAYVGTSDGWRGGLVGRTPGLLAALQAARDASPVRRATAAKVGPAEVSATLDKVPLGTGASPGWRYTLALTARDAGAGPGPSGGAGRGMREQMELLAASKRGAAAPGPFMILELQPPEPGRDAALLRPKSDKPFRYAGAVVTVGEIRLAADGGLASATFPAWRPPPEFFLAGRTARDVFMAHDMAGEQAINDTVVEWKTRQLPGWLQRATGAQLEEAIVQTEKGLLALDLAVRSVKDQVDAAARKNETAFPDAGAIEQLLEQRKMLVGVVLQAMKGAAAQKVR